MNSPDSIQTRLGWVLSYFKGERTEAVVHHWSGSPSPEEALHKGCISLHWLVQHSGSEHLTTHKQAVWKRFLFSFTSYLLLVLLTGHKGSLCGRSDSVGHCEHSLWMEVVWQREVARAEASVYQSAQRVQLSSYVHGVLGCSDCAQCWFHPCS